MYVSYMISYTMVMFIIQIVLVYVLNKEMLRRAEETCEKLLGDNVPHADPEF